MPTERKVGDIPEGELPGVIEDFESEGCTTRSEKQADDLWTVYATCPDNTEKPGEEGAA